MYFNIAQPLVCKKGDEASPSIILAGQALLVKMLITLEPHGIFGSNFAYLCIPDKIRNATRRTDQLSKRSQVMGQFRLYRCKGMSGTAALYIVCNQASKMCTRKLAKNQVGVKL